MIQQVVTPNNLGLTIKANHLVANKYDVQVDNASIKVSALGVIFADTSALISADAGNDLINGSDSKLFVDVPIKGVQIDGVTIAPDVNGIVNLTDNDINSVIDSSTIDLTLVGTQVSAVVKVSALAGNLITTQPDGLSVSPSSVRSLLDVQVTDAFGVPLYYASSTNV